MNKIIFLVTNRFGNIPDKTKDTIILTWDDWNDYSYYTLFGISYVNNVGESIGLGAVRIAYYGQKTGYKEKALKINDKFEKLEENYFSLGTDDIYYENLNKLGDELRDQILNGLNDIALNSNIYEKAIKEDVTLTSLLRDIPFSTVTNQYKRIATGGARLTDYSFSYYFPQNKVTTNPSKITFEVIAEHNPPTNIQIIIGRNGVGKSHLLNGMVDSLLNNHSNIDVSGKFVFDDLIKTESFTNLICVTFSAFDEFQFHNKQVTSQIKYHYIGLRNLEKINEVTRNSEGNIKFADEFTSSLGLIISSSKKSRWKAAIKQLDSDPIFKDEDFIGTIDSYTSNDIKPIQEKFAKLSSGHKIILLTITKLVELLQEKSLVFFDEPETHLHPPLLSSFIRAISELLTSRNAVSIMTTHSPIVLQEVPNSCVLKLSRKGNLAKFERPKLETFGENIGVLTNDIFGLEVTESGFYNLLRELVRQNKTYEEALESINHKLGVEGRAILRSLFFDKN
ncbi:AAA family ATPase [Rufibacter latericius]|uniref:ATP-binding cassette domain-containing protein n=1 Tax=Rufibacter latericius TaxID=2487040 RepID=A0A3M9MZX1_9BACT|nr:AAA family ATPase [Rufibacter latericius]RNI30443.1 ATP-binding cassette domain-containing protein [Rufibacter latericius]